ncbi:MAG TPA: MFS transporter, partial [Pseudoxanthomonas sp.]|nr:MFS transporter [Pseudoxanthomonas sp.]
GAPLLAVLGGALRRKTLLLALMAFYAAGNLASALAPDYASLLLFRFIAGLPHGAYFGVAALSAVAISRPEARGRAVSLVMFGLTLAILAGVPLATWAGQLVSWRWVFAVVAVLSLLTVALVALYLPAASDGPRGRPLVELRAFNRTPVWQALAIGAIGFSGMFCVFSYIAPTMIQVTGVAPALVPLAVAGFGLGGVIGNIAGGWLFDRLQFRSVAAVLGWAVLVLLLFPLAARWPWSLLLATVAIGMMGALGPILQSHLMDVAGEAQTLAAASHHAAFNTANALGPWLGGLAIGAGLGWTSTGPVGAATAMAGLLVYAWAIRTHQRRQACPAL